MMQKKKNKSLKTKGLYHFYFFLFKGFWKWFVLFFISILSVTFLDGILIYVSKFFVDDGIRYKSIESVIKIASTYSLFMVLNFIANFGHVYFSRLFSQHIRYKLRQLIFKHLQALSFSFFDRSNTGQLIATTMTDTENIANFLSGSVVGMLWCVFSIIISCVFMLKLNVRLALYLILLTPVLTIIAIFFQKLIIAKYRVIRKFIANINRAYNENIRGIKIVKSFFLEKINLKEFKGISDTLYDNSIKAGKLSAIFTPLIGLVCVTFLIYLVFNTGYNFDKLNISIGDIQAFILYAFSIINPIRGFTFVFTSLQNSLVATERVYLLLNEKIEIQDKEDTINQSNYSADIEFQNVSFYYKQNIPVISNLNLKISNKETIAIAGPSGAGKTTLVHLLSRFYEPQEGEIKINGKDYREFSLYSYQKRVEIISQNPGLFSCSIKENIKYGHDNIADEAVIDAARIAGAHDFITGFSEGYDYNVGQNGSLLSSGQKQLLCIARALINKPDIFILDEATSLIDPITENQFKIGLKNLKKKFTIIIIAHRLSTITHADKIIFLEKGKIIEQGSHSSLLKRKGRYYELYMKQFQDKIEQKFELLSD